MSPELPKGSHAAQGTRKEMLTSELTGWRGFIAQRPLERSVRVGGP